MLVTPSEMINDVKPAQRLNALLSMLVTEEGIVTDVNSPQFWNALLLMLVTEVGIVTDLIVQLLNAELAMLVTE